VFFLNDTWFALNGNVNSQNTRYWSSENRHSVHDFPLHNRVRVQCTMIACKTIRPVFFKEITNSYHYIVLILTSLFRQLWPPRYSELKPCYYLWEALKGPTLYFKTFNTAPHHTHIYRDISAHMGVCMYTVYIYIHYVKTSNSPF
jgi:hypothetical protein